MKKYRDNAPAKINLCLHITGRRPNGMHIIDSIVVFADIADSITIEPCKELSLEIKGDMKKFLTGAEQKKQLDYQNTIIKAIESFGRITKQKIKARITLDKKLPVSAGLGGGSADAAAVIRILKKIYPATSANLLFASCEAVGADTLACLYKKPARMTGIGNKLDFFSLPCEMAVVLINPLKKINTAEIYQDFDRMKKNYSEPLPQDCLQKTKNREDFINMLQSTHNDLYAAAKARLPVIEKIMETIKQFDNSLLTAMSGSGATCFLLFDNLPNALQAEMRLKQIFPLYWIISAKIKGTRRITMPKLANKQNNYAP